LACHRRFTSYEQPAEQVLVVVKRDGRREDFDRRKLSESIRHACHKRPVPLDQIERVVTDVEGGLLQSGQREVSSRDIGERVMLALKKLDEIAYVRFASVYRSFRDVDTLADEIAEYKEWRLRDEESKRQMPLSL
jgi:transcriptional repressor NrdR